jgi:hypothetical protein
MTLPGNHGKETALNSSDTSSQKLSYMKRLYSIAAVLLLSLSVQAWAQNPTQTSTPAPRPATQQTARPQQPPPGQVSIDLSEYGVQIRPEPRLILMMAALEAAGFDPTPEGENLSAFRAQVRRDQQNLDTSLRQRMQSFYERNKLKRSADGREPTPAEQASRYVSLAYTLGPAPEFQEPVRADDLPAGLLEVLDFAPLVREFYRKSGISERMPAYLKAYQAEGDRLRRSTAEMIRDVVAYLNTKPTITTIERIPVAETGDKKKKDAPIRYIVREHERRFFIVPDLLAAPGTVNFRAIADDYYVTVPYCDETRRICPGRDGRPASPEVRRAYVQYVVDPLVVRFNRDIAARKEQIKQLLDERAKTGVTVSPDVFLTVARSLVIAADVRMDETTQIRALETDARARIDKTTDAAKRAEIVKELETARTLITDETTAQLAEGYENGAVLAFYFADQLRGVESSGFDISSALSDMIASFDVAREMRRLEEADTARKRALAARKTRTQGGENTSAINSLQNAALVKKLLDVDQFVRLKNYAAAEERLLAILREFPGEPRVFFALAETANLSAKEAADDAAESEGLYKALTNYRNAVRASTPDTDRCLLVRAHEAMGSILLFLEETGEALKEFDAAIGLNVQTCEAHGKAVEAKKKLAAQK